MRRFRTFFRFFSIKYRYLNYLYHYDRDNYFNYSCLNDNNPQCIVTKLIILVHAIEKGLSLPNCRKGFGKQKIKEMINLCREYENNSLNIDTFVVESVYSIIKAYIEFHSKDKIDLSFIPKETYNRAIQSKFPAGIQVLSSTIDPLMFQLVSNHRHSVRYYSSQPVSQEDVRKAVALAQSAPSACNRQPIRVYAITTTEIIQQIMRQHNGIRSFSAPSVIFIITGDRTLYQNEYERNTVYVDGGIFTMNLLYALDSLGIASCPAIWGNIPSDDKVIVQLANIPKHHTIINLIVAGYYPDEKYVVASSTKRDVDSILNFV